MNESRRRDFGRRYFRAIAAAAAGLLACGHALAQASPAPSAAGSVSPIDADGSVTVPSFSLPPSVYLSEEAKAALPRKPSDPQAPLRMALKAGKAGEMRARMKEFMGAKTAHLISLYPVTLTDTTIAGVPAVRIRPTGGIPAGNAKKVLLNLPGGGFVMASAHGTGMYEAVPLASLARTEIISVTYRQGPEFKHPAGLEDAIAVYRELLKSHKPQDIAIFGCSAGGLLTAQLVAALPKANLPMPAAAGIFCASADARFAGDSQNYARPFAGFADREEGALDYFSGIDRTDPSVSPLFDPEALERFPPTLIITATRAMDMSSAVNTHRALTLAGVDARLQVWDGLEHAFFYNIDLPEAKEAFEVQRNFFAQHLKLTR